MSLRFTARRRRRAARTAVGAGATLLAAWALLAPGAAHASAGSGQCSPAPAATGAAVKSIDTSAGCDVTEGTAGDPASGFMSVGLPSRATRAVVVDAFQAIPDGGADKDRFYTGAYTVAFSDCTGGFGAGGAYILDGASAGSYPLAAPVLAAGTPPALSGAAGSTVTCAYTAAVVGTPPAGELVSFRNDIWVTFYSPDGEAVGGTQTATASVKPFAETPPDTGSTTSSSTGGTSSESSSSSGVSTSSEDSTTTSSSSTSTSSSTSSTADSAGSGSTTSSTSSTAHGAGSGSTTSSTSSTAHGAGSDSTSSSTSSTAHSAGSDSTTSSTASTTGGGMATSTSRTVTLSTTQAFAAASGPSGAAGSSAVTTEAAASSGADVVSQVQAVRSGAAAVPDTGAGELWIPGVVLVAAGLALMFAGRRSRRGSEGM